MPYDDPSSMADALLRYPTGNDVGFARQQDYSYGKPWAPYFEGKRFTSLAGPLGQEPDIHNPQMASVGTGGGQFLGTKPSFNDYYGKAALASNRSALAMLGFDPTKTAVDLGSNPDQYRIHIAGSYNPDNDKMYANAYYPSAIVHESLHRGIEKLHDSPYWQKQFDPLFENLHNEYVVRLLMKEKMGNPEFMESGGPVTFQQRQDATKFFNDPEHRSALEGMEGAAAQYLAAKQPRGPR